MSTVIKVENLSKLYLIGHQQNVPYQTLRDTMVHGAKDILRAPYQWLRTGATKEKASTEEFWALDDVSFEVNDGDRVGIIGRNGAGKSTLLKILSRITEPTKGRIKIKGRIASLLEVGTGFHPELTGRENIYLNGAVLGMSRSEVQRKFDEIVDFAEIERFLDTPVKRYSSGMYVRLAFAVAAHLEPDILVVDEVLAVGDVAFQKKCMSRMSEVGAQGRTVLFVSHNMSAIEQLCNSVILLRDGTIIEKSSDVKSTIRNFISTVGGALTTEWHNDRGVYQNEWFTPTHFYLGDESGSKSGSQIRGVNESIFVYVEGHCKCLDPALQVGVAVYNEDSALIFWSYTSDNEVEWVNIATGQNRLRLEIPGYLLNEGSYRIELGIALYHRMWICEPGSSAPSITFEVQGGFLASKYWSQRRPGLLAPCFSWKRLG
jgi:lipopolysaccharide transport system ATP-binding protein